MSQMTSALIGHERNIYLSYILLKIMKKGDIIRLVDIVRLFNIKWNDATSLLRFMSNKNYIIKVSKGYIGL
jgi:Mn-dependent DtxR family transcriptional regulator